MIVAGSRSIDDRELIGRAIEDGDLVFGPLDEIVHGGASGVDEIAGEIAEERGFDVRVMEAEWDEFGHAAGPIRNQEMAEYADALVAVWDGESAGTENMIETALDEGLGVYTIQA